MKTTLSLIVLMTSILGFMLVGNALAQSIDAGPAIEAPTEAEPAPEVAPAEPASEEAAAPVATATEAPPEKVLDQGKALYKSVKGGEWLLAFGFLGMLLGSIARFAVGKKWEFLKTKAGGYTIAGFTGLGILGALIIEAGAFSVSMVPTAITGMLAAMALHGPAKAVKEKLKGPTEA